jgi:hypothetical protein
MMPFIAVQPRDGQTHVRGGFEDSPNAPYNVSRLGNTPARLPASTS